MASAALKSFKPKQPDKANFWFMLGIEDAETGRTDAVHKGFTDIQVVSWRSQMLN